MASIRFRKPKNSNQKFRLAVVAIACVCAVSLLVSVFLGWNSAAQRARKEVSHVQDTQSKADPDGSSESGGTNLESQPLEETSGLDSLLGDLDGVLPQEIATAPIRREVSERSGNVQSVATSLVEQYQEEESSSVVHAGYLDLLGNVWGLAVMGPGWVDLCLITRRTEDTSKVVRVRMEAKEWEKNYADANP